METKASALKC